MSDDPILAALIRIEAGQIEYRQRFEALERRFDTLEQRFDKLEQRFDKLEAGQTQLRVAVMDRIDRLENALSEIRDDIGVNMGRADRAHQAADSTRSELRELSQEMTVMWRQIKRLDTRVSDIESGRPSAA